MHYAKNKLLLDGGGLNKERTSEQSVSMRSLSRSETKKIEDEKVLTSASRVTSMVLGGEVETAAELRAMAAKSMPARDK